MVKKPWHTTNVSMLSRHKNVNWGATKRVRLKHVINWEEAMEVAV